VSVCLSVGHTGEPAKTAKPSEMPFGRQTRVGSRNHVLVVSISQVIGCEDRLRNDLYCVEWGVKLYSSSPVR